jgi:hypothetical protein
VPSLERLRRDRRAEQVALVAVAAQRAQHVELRWCLDAFGGDRELQAAREPQSDSGSTARTFISRAKKRIALPPAALA